MKKILFWVLFIPLGIVVLIAGFIGGVCEWIDTKANKFEEWCLWK